MIIGSAVGIAATDAKAATILTELTVPAKDSINNINERDVVGNKTDDETGNSLYSKEFVLEKHVHMPQNVYPTLANGVAITGAVGAWTLGAFAVIIPSSTITRPFDIHHVNVESYNANDDFELVLYSGADGAEVEIGRCRFARLTNVGSSPFVPMMTPINNANSQIKGKIATKLGTSNFAAISLDYHMY